MMDGMGGIISRASFNTTKTGGCPCWKKNNLHLFLAHSTLLADPKGKKGTLHTKTLASHQILGNTALVYFGAWLQNFQLQKQHFQCCKTIIDSECWEVECFALQIGFYDVCVCVWRNCRKSYMAEIKFDRDCAILDNRVAVKSTAAPNTWLRYNWPARA